MQSIGTRLQVLLKWYLEICKNCRGGTDKRFLFCQRCGIRDPIRYDPNPGWLKGLKQRFFRSAIDRAFENMTEFGSLQTERELEQLQRESATQTGREKVGSSLALTYGIRALHEEFWGNDPEEAIFSYEQAIRAAPKEAKWHQAKARAIERLAEDMKHYQELTEDGLYPHRAALLSLFSASSDKLEEMCNRESTSSLLEKAEFAYSEAIYREPSFTPALIGRARIATETGNEVEAKGDYETAIKILDRALTVYPNDITSRKERAEAFEGLGQIEKAIEDLQYSVSLEKDDSIERHIKELVEKSTSNRKSRKRP